MRDTGLNALLRRDPDTIRCPYDVYHGLRAEAPIHWVEDLHAFMVTSYDDILEVLRHPETYSSAFASGPGSPTVRAQKLLASDAVPEQLRRQMLRRLDINAKPVLLIADPPVHLRQRALVSKGFAPRRIAALEGEIRRTVEGLVDAFPDSGEVEFMTGFAQPLPLTVIAAFLGVPLSRLGDLKKWSDAFTAGLGAVDQSVEEMAVVFGEMDEFYDYFSEQIALRRQQPGEDLVSALVTARVEGEEPLSENEILQMLVQFLIGGNETTTGALGSLMVKLAGDPELQARVRADLSLVPALVETVLRLESPVQGMWRVTTTDTELHGVALPKGSMLWLVYGAANRDESAFPDGDEVTADTVERCPHLAFGRGEHFCVGAALARLETRVAVEVLLSRTRTLSLATPIEEIPYLPSFVLHCPRDLRVRFATA